MLAYKIGTKQISVSDTIELYASYLLVEFIDHEDKRNKKPYIHIQNVGTKILYFDKYMFNGREYFADSQIIPSTYSQASNAFYRIQLPINDENYVFLSVYYHDINNKYWISNIICERGGDFGWEIKTLPRSSIKSLNNLK